jgi:hypothetical protein
MPLTEVVPELPPGWTILDQRTDAQIREAEARARAAALKGSDERLAAYRDAWLNFVTHVAAPDMLTVWCTYRLRVAQTWSAGRGLSRRERETFVTEAQEQVVPLGPALVMAAEQAPLVDWARAAEWTLVHSFESAVPSVVTRLGTPIAQAIAALLADYGLGRVERQLPGMDNQPGELAVAVRHAILTPERWPGAEMQLVPRATELLGEAHMTHVWEWVQGPLHRPWLRVVDAARGLNPLDVERGLQEKAKR